MYMVKDAASWGGWSAPGPHRTREEATAVVRAEGELYRRAVGAQAPNPYVAEVERVGDEWVEVGPRLYVEV